jgi:uncharacterized protein
MLTRRLAARLSPQLACTLRSVSSSSSACAGAGLGERDVELFQSDEPSVANARVDSYDPAGFVIGGARHLGPALCYEGVVLNWRAAAGARELSPAALSPLLLFAHRPELLVLGVGERMERPSAELSEWCRREGVGLEVLSTGNAVATYNVLAQEGRRVAGAFLTSA